MEVLWGILWFKMSVFGDMSHILWIVHTSLSCPHGITWLEGLSGNFILDTLSIICHENPSLVKTAYTNRHFTLRSTHIYNVPTVLLIVITDHW
jgi:hypothetical protein